MEIYFNIARILEKYGEMWRNISTICDRDMFIVIICITLFR